MCIYTDGQGERWREQCVPGEKNVLLFSLQRTMAFVFLMPACFVNKQLFACPYASLLYIPQAEEAPQILLRVLSNLSKELQLFCQIL